MTSIPSSSELSSADLVTDPPSPPPVVREIDFHDLSRSMQDRFVACTRSEAAPRPVLVAEPRSSVALWSTFAIVAGASVLSGVVTYGFGRLDRRQALHAITALPIYVLAIATAVLGVTQLLRLRAERRALPWRRALYLFPLTLVDARDARLRVISLGDVVSAERDPRTPRDVRVVLTTGEVLTLPTRSEEQAIEALRAIESGREQARSFAHGDPRTTLMFTLDPLQRPRLSSPLGTRARLSPHTPEWTRRAWIAAPIAGLLFAPPLRTVRNAASDRVLFHSASARGDADAFRAYIALDGSRTEEVRTTLLPRAELHDAEKEGSVEAIDRYEVTHPGQIPDEVSAARRRAMLDELARAKKPGTVAALQDFAKKRPDHGLEPELREAMHALFAPALVAYRNKPMRGPEVRSFVERLFAWSEAKAHAGSAATTIQIRFRKRPTTSIKRADKMVAHHHWFIGEASYPSRYFDANHAQKREKAFGELLARRVRDAFGPTVFTVEVGPRLDDAPADGEALPQVSEPTLFVTHAEDWRGKFDGSITKPRGIWVALAHHFEAVFVIPGDPRALRFELDIQEPIPQKVIKEHPEGGTPAAPLEEKIYGTMADAAFTTFSERFASTVLPPPS